MNLAEWKIFAKRTVEYAGALVRETDLDQALENRRRLEERWDSILAQGSAARRGAEHGESEGDTGCDSLLAEGGAAQVLYMELPPGVRFEKVAL